MDEAIDMAVGARCELMSTASSIGCGDSASALIPITSTELPTTWAVDHLDYNESAATCYRQKGDHIYVNTKVNHVIVIA